MAQVLGSTQVSALLETVPGIASVLRSPVADALVNMIKAGIIDPVKVTRGTLSNAASIAAMILTTEVLITDVQES